MMKPRSVLLLCVAGLCGLVAALAITQHLSGNQKYRAILYFQDESNVSLTAFLGKTWAPRGQTPKALVTGKRGGVGLAPIVVASLAVLLTGGCLDLEKQTTIIAFPAFRDPLQVLLV